jgi:hypothetical protein
MTLVVAHAGHWLMSVGFAGPPLAMVAGLAFLAMRERRRDDSGTHA